MTLMTCSTCGDQLKGRWGTRCYTCNPGGSPKAGEDRLCETCGKMFYVPGWKIRDVERRQGAHCSRQCLYESQRINPKGTPRWGQRLYYEYGITYQQFLDMEEQQEGKCAICSGEPNGPGGKRLQVDHCHGTGKVRGLLCSRCNTAIGLLKEDPALFAGAVKYLSPNYPLKGGYSNGWTCAASAE